MDELKDEENVVFIIVHLQTVLTAVVLARPFMFVRPVDRVSEPISF